MLLSCWGWYSHDCIDRWVSWCLTRILPWSSCFSEGGGNCSFEQEGWQNWCTSGARIVWGNLSITAEGGVRGWVHYKSVKSWVVWRRWIAPNPGEYSGSFNCFFVLLTYFIWASDRLLFYWCVLFYFLFSPLGFGCQLILYRNRMPSCFSPGEKGNTLWGQRIKKER